MDCGTKVGPGGVQSQGLVHTVGVQEVCIDRGACGQASANAAPDSTSELLSSQTSISFYFG